MYGPSNRLRAIWAHVMYLSVGAGPFLEMIRGVLAWEREREREKKREIERVREREWEIYRERISERDRER